MAYASAANDKDELSALIHERLRLSSLQARIPASSLTVLPSGKQLLFLGPKHSSMSGHLSLQVLDLADNESNAWFECCDLSSPAVSALSTELSLEQKLQRERTRTAAHGITSYTLHAASSQLLFTYGPHLVSCSVPRAPALLSAAHPLAVRKLGSAARDAEGARMDSQLTADGRLVVFGRGADLFATTTQPVDAQQGEAAEVALTAAGEGHECGVADFINQEEFDRLTAFWLAPAVKEEQKQKEKVLCYSIMYLDADSSAVPVVSIPSQGGVEEHKWPRAGEANCALALKAVSLTVPKDWDGVDAKCVTLRRWALKQSLYASYPWLEYVVRAGWTGRQGEVWLQLLDRAQMRSALVLFTLADHFEQVDSDAPRPKDDDDAKVDEALRGQELVRLSGSPWINVDDAHCFVAEGVLWTAEHSGFKHLYFVGFPAKKHERIEEDEQEEQDEEQKDPCAVRQRFRTPASSKVVALTAGRWAVEGERIDFDAASKTVFLSARRDSHLEKHLFALPFDPSDADAFDLAHTQPRQLTHSGFFHDARIRLDEAADARFFSSVFSSVSAPRQLGIFARDGKCVKQFAVPHRGSPDKLKYVEPEIVDITNFPADATEQQKEDAEFVELSRAHGLD